MDLRGSVRYRRRVSRELVGMHYWPRLRGRWAAVASMQVCMCGTVSLCLVWLVLLRVAACASHVFPFAPVVSCMGFRVTQPFGGVSGEGQYHLAGLVGTVGALCVGGGASGRRLCGWAPVNYSCLRT